MFSHGNAILCWWLMAWQRTCASCSQPDNTRRMFLASKDSKSGSTRQVPLPMNLSHFHRPHCFRFFSRQIWKDQSLYVADLFINVVILILLSLHANDNAERRREWVLCDLAGSILKSVNFLRHALFSLCTTVQFALYFSLESLFTLFTLSFPAPSQNNLRPNRSTNYIFFVFVFRKL